MEEIVTEIEKRERGTKRKKTITQIPTPIERDNQKKLKQEEPPGVEKTMAMEKRIDNLELMATAQIEETRELKDMLKQVLEVTTTSGKESKSDSSLTHEKLENLEKRIITLESGNTAKGDCSFKEQHKNEIIKKINNLQNYKLIFSAHGLPEKNIKNGDPYQWQVEQSVNKIIKALNINNLDWILSYQSRVGPLKWIGPSTEDVIIENSKLEKHIVLVPIAFVSEHSETLVELDIEYKELADKNGCKNYTRVSALGTNENFIKAMSELIIKKEEYNFNNKLYPPKIHCPNNLKNVHVLIMNSYLLFKSLHLITVVSWMAGLLYLPRIFVYHVENNEKKQSVDIFEVMEKRLYFYIMRPAMILTWLFGIILVYLNGVEIFSQLWMQLKFVLVILLSIFRKVQL